MPSLGHVAVGLAVARRGRPTLPWRSALFFASLALLPDLDVLGFWFGVPYGDPFGHRGASHSLAAALLVAVVVAGFAKGQRSLTFACALLAVGSHGLLDTLTNGGLGVALLWPFTNARYFAPWRPIPVAPLGLGMLSARGLHVLAAELAIFSPFLVFALWPRRWRSPKS